MRQQLREKPGLGAAAGPVEAIPEPSFTEDKDTTVALSWNLGPHSYALFALASLLVKGFFYVLIFVL